MKKLLLLAVVVAIVAAIPFVVVRADDSTMPAVGQSAPTFTLPSQTGDAISLDSYRGKMGRALLLSQGHDHRLHH